MANPISADSPPSESGTYHPPWSPTVERPTPGPFGPPFLLRFGLLDVALVLVSFQASLHMRIDGIGMELLLPEAPCGRNERHGDTATQRHAATRVSAARAADRVDPELGNFR